MELDVRHDAGEHAVERVALYVTTLPRELGEHRGAARVHAPEEIPFGLEDAVQGGERDACARGDAVHLRSLVAVLREDVLRRVEHVLAVHRLPRAADAVLRRGWLRYGS